MGEIDPLVACNLAKDNNIKIYEDDKLTDDTNYKIEDNNIVRDNEDKEFSVISLIKKKNNF